jgi:hypothetical protein
MALDEFRPSRCGKVGVNELDRLLGMRDMKAAMEAIKASSSGVSKIIALMEAAANATAYILSWRPLTPTNAP